MVASVSLERSESEAGPWAAVSARLTEESGQTVALDQGAVAGTTYHYRLRVRLATGEVEMFGPVSGRREDVVTAFALERITPNPTGAMPVLIEYAVGREAPVRLSIVDVQGRVRAVLVDRVVPAGRHRAVLRHKADIPAGLYFVIYQAAERVHTHRVIVTR